MSANRPISVFDVIGPIMVGPSSSHTAGAVRLGLIGRATLGEPPLQARLLLHGSFARTGRGHGTHLALVAGLLGLSPADERIRNSLLLAQQAGLQITFETIDLGEEAHPNSVRMELQGQQQTLTLTGASIGGGLVEVTELQGYRVRFSGELDTLVLIADDQPGTVNTISGWLAGHHINIATLRVKRNERGGQAIMILETDQSLPSTLTYGLETLPWVHWVRAIPRIKE
jgi:L-serine dehydratase